MDSLQEEIFTYTSVNFKLIYTRFLKNSFEQDKNKDLKAEEVLKVST